MRLGDVANAGAAGAGKPLDGVRILALEQMQALPYATQLLARLGAEVVKVEHPKGGDLGRGSLPAMTDPEGRSVGATFLRNNLNKRSICIDLKAPEGRDLVLRLAPHFDVFAENSKAGAMARLGLGYDDIAAVHPGVVYLSVSGFGNTVPSPYDAWPAFAPIVEAMSGIYEFKREGDQPPVAAPVGALGDIGSALYAVIGVLAGLRHRDATGRGQHVDIAMLDAMVAMTDLVTNFWSLGLRGGNLAPLIMHGFRASDGWFIIQVGREPQFAALAELVGEAGWVDDPRFADRQGWVDHLDDVIRPAVEGWAATRTRLEACEALSAAGIAAGPCFTDDEVVADEHVAARHMLVEMPRTDGVEQPVLIPGNPVKMTAVA
jgi:formyl-CoA transferase